MWEGIKKYGWKYVRFVACAIVFHAADRVEHEVGFKNLLIFVLILIIFLLTFF